MNRRCNPSKPFLPRTASQSSATQIDKRYSRFLLLLFTFNLLRKPTRLTKAALEPFPHDSSLTNTSKCRGHSAVTAARPLPPSRGETQRTAAAQPFKIPKPVAYRCQFSRASSPSQASNTTDPY